MKRRLKDQIQRLPILCILLVSANIVVFIPDFLAGGVLSYFGGVHRTAIMENHEYARLFWAMFLHSDVAHLSNNMIILFFLGSMLEDKVGHIWFSVIYFLSGVGGNVASLVVKIINRSDALSIGASGAVFGLDGLLLALVMFSPGFRESIPPARVVLMIILSLYDGFVGHNIDNAAHLGGLVIGFLCGIVYTMFQSIHSRKCKEVTM